MKTIPLTKGFVALVDDEDFDFLNQWKWYAQTFKHTQIVYAHRVEYQGKGKKMKSVLMHRVLLGAMGLICGDHRDGNGLNNQKHNLRPATYTQNARNRVGDKDSRSQLKGVHWRGDRKRWEAVIVSDGVRKRLGSFRDRFQAARVYDGVAKELFGEFARTNESMGLL